MTNADRSKRYRRKKIERDPEFLTKEKDRIAGLRRKTKENDSQEQKDAKIIKERE